MEMIEVYFETRVTKFTLALLVARRARGKTTHANARLLKEISCVEKSSALFYFCFVKGVCGTQGIHCPTLAVLKLAVCKWCGACT